MKRKAGPLRVYFKGDTSTAHERRILQGLAEYGHGPPIPWWVRWGNLYQSASVLRNEGYRGVVFFSLRPEQVVEYRTAGMHSVRVGSIHQMADVPAILPDNAAIGRLAARHFQELLFSSFAFVGPSDHGYATERVAGYQEALDGRASVHWLHGSSHEDEQRKFREWLRGLPERTAVFAANDIFARRVLEACLGTGLRVPEDIAVLGVDDDPLVVLSSPVPISSIDPNSREIGRRAAARLEELLFGPQRSKSAATEERVPPAGVVLRASTDVLATDDAVVAQAARIMREEACTETTVADICRRVGVGRRNFEMRFGRVIGRTPEAQMRALRIARAKQLLENSQGSIQEVAATSGFRDQLYFSNAFKKATGLSPKAWREKNRRKAPGCRT